MAAQTQCVKVTWNQRLRVRIDDKVMASIMAAPVVRFKSRGRLLFPREHGRDMDSDVTAARTMRGPGSDNARFLNAPQPSNKSSSLIRSKQWRRR